MAAKVKRTRRYDATRRQEAAQRRRAAIIAAATGLFVREGFSGTTISRIAADAGVSEEDRALLLGHAIMGMPQHYATATIARLVEAANKVQETRDRTTVLRVVNS